MPSQFITFRSEYNYRHANVPYFAGEGGVTPPGGNTGAPGSFVPGWAPDLRPSEKPRHVRHAGEALVRDCRECHGYRNHQDGDAADRLRHRDRARGDARGPGGGHSAGQRIACAPLAPGAAGRPIPAPCRRPGRFDGVRCRAVSRSRPRAGRRGAGPLCLCRHADDVIWRMLPSRSTVVVGGSAGTWRASREERLARRLTHLGHRVVFAPIEEPHVEGGAGQSGSVSHGMFDVRSMGHFVVLVAVLALGMAPRVGVRPGPDKSGAAPADLRARGAAGRAEEAGQRAACRRRGAQGRGAQARRSEAGGSRVPRLPARPEVRRQPRHVLRLQLQSAARACEPAARVRRDEQQLQPEPGERVARERAGSSRPAAGSARASICSTARRPRRCRAACRTSRGRGSTATSSRPTARMCFRWVRA